MGSLMARWGMSLPVLAAPMAGGTSTPAMVVAAGRAGGLGFLAAGYRSAEGIAGQIREVRAQGVVFGVNVFAPNPVPVDQDAYRRYAEALRGDAGRLGAVLPEAPVEDDDFWAEKVELLLSDPVPLVSFTFGLPAAGLVKELRAAGTSVLQTVTNADEARAAAELGVDGLIVQASAAGGHSGTLTPERAVADVPLPELVARIRHAADLPVIAAGGLATSAQIAEVLHAGAQAAMVGTVLLRADESGASAPYRQAIANSEHDTTVITRAFTGRPARGLRNRFIDRYEPLAPAGYPAIHHLTSPLRKAAAAAAETGLLHLWAGTGHRHTRPEPAAEILTRLARAL
ncbi:NAD(P)H-dependent flavin oxidoreductase [Actinocorallia longicatena]|uniref:Propionate 3-nitronate monooxygenase n=1 Tax=Actinocorallia longicatena TaxID=111803 RepID=A0ABP6QLA0_9ACTN